MWGIVAVGGKVYFRHILTAQVRLQPLNQFDVYRLMNEVVDLHQDEGLVRQGMYPSPKTVAPLRRRIGLAEAPPTPAVGPLGHMVSELFLCSQRLESKIGWQRERRR